MCISSAPVVSKLPTPLVVDRDTISGDDSLSDQFVIIEFHPSGPPTCVGEDVNGTRYFHLPKDEYNDMELAIAAGLEIRFRARENASHQFTRVKWEGVTS